MRRRPRSASGQLDPTLRRATPPCGNAHSAKRCAIRRARRDCGTRGRGRAICLGGCDRRGRAAPVGARGAGDRVGGAGWRRSTETMARMISHGSAPSTVVALSCARPRRWRTTLPAPGRGRGAPSGRRPRMRRSRAAGRGPARSSGGGAPRRARTRRRSPRGRARATSAGRAARSAHPHPGSADGFPAGARSGEIGSTTGPCAAAGNAPDIPSHRDGEDHEDGTARHHDGHGSHSTREGQETFPTASWPTRAADRRSRTRRA